MYTIIVNNCDKSRLTRYKEKKSKKMYVMRLGEREREREREREGETSIRILVQHALQNAEIRCTKTQALMEQFLVNIKVNATRELLTSNERFDNSGYLPLLVDINQGLQLYKRWQRCKSRENVGVSWWTACASVGVNLHGKMRCGRVN